MSVYVECICGKKFEIDRQQVQQFDCQGCGRNLQVPSPELEQQLNALRRRMQEGEPGMRDAMQRAADLREFHAVPLLKEGAGSGMREAVNIALTGLVDFPGPGHDVLDEWFRTGALSMSRLISAMRETKYEQGAGYICELMETGRLKENQVAEVAPYLGDSNSVRALKVLREARQRYPNLGGPLDQAMARMRHLSATAGAIPDSAKRIPGRELTEDQPPEKKGCMGLMLALVLMLGMLGAVTGWVLS
jgi:hypothetical protein